MSDMSSMTEAEWMRELKQRDDLLVRQGEIIKALRAEIGEPPAGSHPDEAKPRAATWHMERANWADEVDRLRKALAVHK